MGSNTSYEEKSCRDTNAHVELQQQTQKTQYNTHNTHHLLEVSVDDVAGPLQVVGNSDDIGQRVGVGGGLLQQMDGNKWTKERISKRANARQ